MAQILNRLRPSCLPKYSFLSARKVPFSNSFCQTIGQITAYYKAVSPDLALRMLADKHWSTFPASETRQMSTPPRLTPASHMTIVEPSALFGYDSARTTYPPTSSSSRPSYSDHTIVPGDTQSPSWSATLSAHHGPSNAPPPLKVMVPTAPETPRTINPFNSPRRSNISQQYSYPSLNPPLSESSQGYTSSKGKYPEDHPPLPSRQSMPNPHESPPEPSIPAPQDYRHARTQIVTAGYSTSSPLHRAAGLPGSAHAGPSSFSGPAAGAAIIHSPVLRSPQLPLHRSPPPYNAYPHSSRTTPTPSANPRERAPLYPPHFQGQPSNSPTSRTRPSSPDAKDRPYHNTANVPYDDWRTVPVPGVRVDGERRRETYPDDHRSSSNNLRFYAGRTWHPPSGNIETSVWTTEPPPQAGWRG